MPIQAVGPPQHHCFKGRMLQRAKTKTVYLASGIPKPGPLSVLRRGSDKKRAVDSSGKMQKCIPLHLQLFRLEKFPRLEKMKERQGGIHRNADGDAHGEKSQPVSPVPELSPVEVGTQSAFQNLRPGSSCALSSRGEMAVQ